MGFDPQAFLQGSTPAAMPMQSPTEDAAPASPAAPLPAPTGFNPKRFINGGKASDALTGADIPLAYSGNTPDTAQNKNPASLTATDRMKMSFGNVAGNIDYLKQKFQDVKPITGPDGKPSQELAVRDGNTWYRVNPKNGDIADPWEKTKEYMKDAAELAPMAIGGGVAAAADIATGGGSTLASGAIAGGAMAAVRTSLGRIVGTYQATPAEQAWDVGFESLLNAAGVKILAGVKPTAKVIANKLPLLAEMFGDTLESSGVKKASGLVADVGSAIASAPKAVFKKIFASYSVGENNFDTMLENTGEVQGTMRKLQDMSGSDVQSYHDQAIRDQVGQIAEVAGNARSTLTQIYGNMRNKLLAKVPGDFSVNLDDQAYAAYKGAIEKGIGVLQVGGKELSGKDAVESIAKNGMKNSGFRMLSQDEMSKALQQGAPLDEGLGYLASSKQAHTILSDFYSNLGKAAGLGGESRTGVEGAKALLDFKKVATNLAKESVDTEGARGINEVRFIINDAKSSIDNQVFQELKTHGLHQDFVNLNQTYDKLATGFAPLLQAQKQAIASGNTKAYESLLSSFLARPRPGASARFAIDDAISAAQSNGLTGLAADLAGNKKSIMVTEAAKAFNPLKSGMTKAQDIGRAGATMAALGSYNPYYITAALGLNAVSTPTGARVGIATTQGISKAQEVLANMSKRQLDAFMSDPQAISSLVTTAIQAPLVRAKADQAFQGMVQQASQKGQGQGQ